MPRPAALACALACLPIAHVVADPPPLPGNAHVTPTVILDRSALVPGSEPMLGVRFQIAPRWHLYWRNSGDSGVPLDIALTLPEGVTAGEPVWPAPKRHVSPGDLLDYIYEREVTIVYPLEVSDQLPPGAKVEVKAAIEFLVCDEVCLPGKSVVSASFDVASTDERGAEAAAFDRARSRWATPLKELSDADVTTGWSGTTLVITAPRATSLTFFPYETPKEVSRKPLEPADPITRCQADAGRLELEYPEEVTSLDPVRGVLEVERAGGTVLILIEVDPPR